MIEDHESIEHWLLKSILQIANQVKEYKVMEHMLTGPESKLVARQFM